MLCIIIIIIFGCEYKGSKEAKAFSLSVGIRLKE